MVDLAVNGLLLGVVQGVVITLVFSGVWCVMRPLLRRERKRQVLAENFSLIIKDARRNLWLARELQTDRDLLRRRGIYARYWTDGLKNLYQYLPDSAAHLEETLWGLIHLMDIDNAMLNKHYYMGPTDHAPEIAQHLLNLKPDLLLLAKECGRNDATAEALERAFSGTPGPHRAEQLTFADVARVPLDKEAEAFNKSP